MMINATSQKQVEAWDFVKFMTSEEGQRQRALAATLLPTRKSLYKDQEVREQVPVMSLAIAEQFNLSLKGETSPEEAVQNLQEELTKIVEQAD
jgi:ABC-type Fe3+ transport system substrate-binding protein